MRLLHTSDWHLGRSFHRVGLLDQQRLALADLVRAAIEHDVDAVLVAGDIYDRALPPVEAVQLLDATLQQLQAAGITVVLTSGNHDSAIRLGFSATLLASSGVHILTDRDRLHEPVLIRSRKHPDQRLACYGIPYLDPQVTASAWQLLDGTTGSDTGPEPTAHTSGSIASAAKASHTQVLTEAMRRIRDDLATRRQEDPGLLSVVMAHAFVAGGQGSDSERDISVGGIHIVPAEVFEGMSYVALGHLHTPQQVNSTTPMHYSGALLHYSFSEASTPKSSFLVDLEPGTPAQSPAQVTPLMHQVQLPLARISGRLDELLVSPDFSSAEDAFCHITVRQEERPANLLAQLSRRFAHILELNWESTAEQAPAASYAQRLAGRSDVEVCCDFLEHVRDRPASPAEERLLARAMEQALAEQP